MTFNILSVSNLGIETNTSAVDEIQAEALAKTRRISSNHMVCMDADGQRTKRWDRSPVEGENRWQKVDPSKMETLGPIRIIKRI